MGYTVYFLQYQVEDDSEWLSLEFYFCPDVVEDALKLSVQLWPSRSWRILCVSEYQGGKSENILACIAAFRRD